MTGPGERIGVLGGTFDPPHNGHLVAAADVRQALGLDRVLLVVANVPWQKVGTRPISPADQRLALVRAAIEGIDGLEASMIEIERGGHSYMVDTLAELREQDPSAHLFLILGADAAGGLNTWERADELPGLATLVLVDRPGLSCPPPPPSFVFERVVIPQLDVSSTELRRRVADGRPLAGLTPVGVATAVDRFGLYRGRR